MSIGSKVRKFREIKSLSQGALAIKCEIISSLESDKSIPSSKLLNRIANVLGVDINELLKDDNVVQNNYDNTNCSISQVTINHPFPENILSLLLSNQEKITNLIESQNNLIASLLKK